MARFPKKESEIVALAQVLWRGLLDNISIYPQPPIHPILLRLKALIHNNRRDLFLEKQVTAEQTVAIKTGALDDLVDAMKSDIRYAENTVKFDDDKLKLLGWAGRKAATPSAVPGQTRLLEAPRQGDKETRSRLGLSGLEKTIRWRQTQRLQDSAARTTGGRLVRSCHRSHQRSHTGRAAQKQRTGIPGYRDKSSWTRSTE